MFQRMRPVLIRLSPLIVLAVAGLVVWGAVIARPSSAKARWRAETHPQTAWVACNRNAEKHNAASTFTPLSDPAAAALVTPEPETRPDNGKPFEVGGVRHAAPNDYVPTNAQLTKFRSAKDSLGEPILKLNPYLKYVDGRDGLHDPTTDELIQWAAHKWGIPENWLRAEYVLESYWNQWFLGDETTVTAALYAQYPLEARVPGTLQVYQSLGITQVRWDPEGDYGAGTEPLRWESTAFNIDEQAAMVRFFYDNPDGARFTWGDKSYVPCEKWNSIGGWFSPYPWGNAGQAQYVKSVKTNLATTAWKSSSFLSFVPKLPPAIKLR